MEILEVKGLRKDFGKNQVLKGIDFSVHEKEIVGFFRTEWFWNPRRSSVTVVCTI